MKKGKTRGRLETKQEVTALLEGRCPDCDEKLEPGPKHKIATTEVLDCKLCDTRFTRMNKEARENFGLNGAEDLVNTVWAQREGPIRPPAEDKK